MWFSIEAVISGVAARSSCGKHDNSEDVNNTDYAGDSVFQGAADQNELMP